MKMRIDGQDRAFEADLGQPLDISIPLRPGSHNPIAWYCGPVRMEAVVNEQFTGDVNLGGSVNFRDIYFNPHGHGTHTECVGHISSEPYTINQSLTTFFFFCRVISVRPDRLENGDLVIHRHQIEKNWPDFPVQAVAIRTLPNLESKLTVNYSNSNPAYLDGSLADFFVEKSIDHLLVDLPSVDREVDGGLLDAHHRFWRYPKNVREHATITEMIYIPDFVPDGIYLLNLQIASFENDAAPSKPVLYALKAVE